MGRLDGKVAVITGGTRGLGHATAKAFVREGAAVVLCGRQEDDAKRAAAEVSAAGGRALGVACDVSDKAQVDALLDAAVRAFGGVDVWLNNAALSAPYGRTLDAPDAFERATRVNVLGTFHGTRAALGHMLPKGRGKLVNLVGRGETGPVPLQNAYASSKAWIRNFTRALRSEYRGGGVDIFTFQPGLMLTDLVQRPEAVAGYGAKLGPLATVLRLWGNAPEDVAEKLVWLASPATDGRRAGAAQMHGLGWMLVGGPLRLLLGRAPKVTLAPVEAGRQLDG